MKESIWQVFRETGDPLCYLLYRAALQERENTKSADVPKSA